MVTSNVGESNLEPEALVAHTPPPGGGPWHYLVDHLKAVADLAGSFGERFGMADVCHALGLSHDIGKASPAFQQYLRQINEGRPAESSPHAAPGAAAAYQQLGSLSLAVLGHHAGISDASGARTKLQGHNVEPAIKLWGTLGGPALPPVIAALPVDVLRAEMLIRMCFSALVDADYLDTEAHFQPQHARQRAAFPTTGELCETLRKNNCERASRIAAPLSTVNLARQEILASCTDKAALPPGAYRLTVPTGGGKTLSGLTFALGQASRHDLDRVIVAIPYTSIIDQTAEIFAGIFGEDNVLEHHSAYEADDSEAQTAKELRRRLAAENWDCPLVVTTTVQLFESLLSNKPARCRKLHNVARSVIILDEVQTLPVQLLLPILDVLAQLIQHYGCSVLFCTATQPDFSGLVPRAGEGASGPAGLIVEAHEIVDDPARFFESLGRVRYDQIAEPLTDVGLAALIDAEAQALCVLNSRPDAVRVLKACRDGDDLFHLSTLMCPKHRKAVLAEVRRRLREGLPVRLVSTQVVEAGVDLDFPTVMRDIGPLDRIVQVAGRCNREGKMEFGRCVVFQLVDAKRPKGAYRTGTDLTRTILADGLGAIDDPAVVASYFRELFSYSEAAGGKGADIQELRRIFSYKSVAEQFKLIDDESVPLVALNYEPSEVEEILKRAAYTPGRALRRQLSKYAVSVSRHHFKELQAHSLVVQHESGNWIYDGAYSQIYGVGTGVERDPADLIV